MAKRKDQEPPEGVSLELIAPWIKELGMSRRANVGYGFTRSEDIERFVKTRTEVHTTYIQETERTRRLGLWLAAGLLAIACLIPIFAPEGRETISYWIGLALFVFAAGAMGYTSVLLRSEKRQISLSKESQDA